MSICRPDPFTISAERRAIGVDFKNATPDDLLDLIFKRNVEKYGDPLGPTVDQLRGQGKSWQDIIAGAIRADGTDIFGNLLSQ